MDSGVNLKQGNRDDLEEAAAVFTSLRPRLFGIAYRMPNERAAYMLREAAVSA